MSFDPNAIRADIEVETLRVFDPPAWEAATEYERYTHVSRGGLVYLNTAKTTAEDPETEDVWKLRGPVIPVLFENVTSKIPAGGAVKILVSWAGTTPQAIPCGCPPYQGGLVDGVLTLFAHTPINEGTKAGLDAITRFRDVIPLWGQLPDFIAGVNRPCYEMSQPTGPASAGDNGAGDFFTHNLTATLTASDNGSGLV